MPTFRIAIAATSRELVARRAACDGCDPARPREEHVHEPAIWIVTAGAFALRDRRGARVLDPTCAIVHAPGEPFEIRHPAGPDTCIALHGPLADVAAATGFASQSHLTNVFRAELGATPGRVRAQRRLA